MTRHEYGDGTLEHGYIISWILPANEISGIDWYHMTNNILFSCILFPSMINLFIFVGN